MSGLSTNPRAPQSVLVADDDLVSRLLMEATLQDLGYQVTAVCNGDEALAVMEREDAPQLAILDWEMPGRTGPEVCHEIRARRPGHPVFLLLLTGHHGTANVVAGLRSGANDYLTKPFNRDELAARLAVAAGFVSLQRALTHRVAELEHALGHIKTLRGLLPICAWCKKIRDDHNYWLQVDEYVAQHTDARFTHGICPSCESSLDDEAERLSHVPPSPVS